MNTRFRLNTRLRVGCVHFCFALLGEPMMSTLVGSYNTPKLAPSILVVLELAEPCLLVRKRSASDSADNVERATMQVSWSVNTASEFSLYQQ